MSARVSAIAAISSRDRGLGKDNDLLWKIPEDLKRFRELTTGHPIIAGRKNFESIGRPLPERTNIIVTRDEKYAKEGILIAHSVEEAIEKAKALDNEEIFVIGGGEIYRAALPYTDRLYLTVIEGEKEADVFFPDYAEFKNVLSQERKESDGIKYENITLER
ncbi:MAG: dihydrofolate reductase [Patescibacteria group bacterium]|nr:dihydrofolate reductase [Patescibacteria group bacterium]